MTRLLMSSVAVAALVAFGSMADAQQAQQPVQTMPNQGAGSGSDTGAGGAAGAGAQTQMPENAQPGTAQQKSSDSMEKSSNTKKKSSDNMQKQSEETKGGDKTKKQSQNGEEFERRHWCDRQGGQDRHPGGQAVAGRQVLLLAQGQVRRHRCRCVSRRGCPADRGAPSGSGRHRRDRSGIPALQVFRAGQWRDRHRRSGDLRRGLCNCRIVQIISFKGRATMPGPRFKYS